MEFNEKLQELRKSKNLTQEELAKDLYVSRTAISRWESGLSVPDADVLIRMAEVLEVSVSRLLGVEVEAESKESLADALEELNEELAAMKQERGQREELDKKRNGILFLSFAALILSLAIKNEVLSILLAAGCLVGALAVLYRNLALFTCVPAADRRLGAVRLTTIFNILLLLLVAGVAVLDKGMDIQLIDVGGRTFDVGIVSMILLFGGFVAPKIPFNRYTGLRLPWTVRDEDTWNIAHQVMGFLSLPLVLVYWSAIYVIHDFEMVSMIAVLLWVGIPGISSGLFFWRRFR